MGEIAELVLNGTLCQVCGCLMEDLIPRDGSKELLNPPNRPRTCEECKKEKTNE